MNPSVSDFSFSKDSGILAGSACLHCSRRKNCPYSCERLFTNALQGAAHQGHLSAKLLTAKAEQLLLSVSLSNDFHQVLYGDESLNSTLSNVLLAELAAIQRLSV